jgi:hypothetical protein
MRRVEQQVAQGETPVRADPTATLSAATDETSIVSTIPHATAQRHERAVGGLARQLSTRGPVRLVRGSLVLLGEARDVLKRPENVV